MSARLGIDHRTITHRIYLKVVLSGGSKGRCGQCGYQDARDREFFHDVVPSLFSSKARSISRRKVAINDTEELEVDVENDDTIIVSKPGTEFLVA
jgi:hypothetical protein